MKGKSMEIDGVSIGSEFPPYIVAEMSANHNGELKNALKTISAAKACGANAIKIQSYTPDSMTIDSNLEDFVIKTGLWKGQNLYALYKGAHTPYSWHKPIFEYAKKEGITCFSTPFDEGAVDLLEDLNCPAYKIASFEITDLPLIKYISSTKKPLIISTGMANKKEISAAIDVIKNTGRNPFVLLHCISAYPAEHEDMNISVISRLQNDFNCSVGLSDHSLGFVAAIASTALGSCFLEKHFILNRSMGGADSTFSIEPSEFKDLVSGVQAAWSCFGQADYSLKKGERENLKYRRSLYAVEKIRKGERIDSDNMRRIRPGYGLAASEYDKVMNKVANVDIERGTPISWDLLI